MSLNCYGIKFSLFKLCKREIRKRQLRKPQHQVRPGSEKKLEPPPVFDYPEKNGNNKLKGKIALITGADSGIGRAVAVLFAKEGADIAIAYLNEHKDARDTAAIIQKKL